ENAEALFEASAEIAPPVVAEFSILRGQPATRPGAYQVGRVEHHQREGAISEWEVAEVEPTVRVYRQGARAVLTMRAVGHHHRLVAPVAEQAPLVLGVEPHHPAAATRIEDDRTHRPTPFAAAARARSS